MHHEYLDEEINLLKKWIINSAEDLVLNDKELLNPTLIDSIFFIENEKVLNREVHETTINHRFAKYLEDRIPIEYKGYNIDIEYNRFINQKKKVTSSTTRNSIEIRPDILVHKRTRLSETTPHLLVIEAKKKSIISKDRSHIKDLLYDFNYKYKFGVLISYFEDLNNINCTLIYFQNNNFNETKFSISK